jgi:nucleoid-associated protein YgaU
MLRYVTSTLTACVLASTINVVAQEQAPAQPEKQQAASKETLTGCVMEAKTTEGGTAYVLNNAEGGSAKMYVLAGSSPTEMASNVNKKVEVTGPVQQPNAPPPDEGAAGKPNVLRPPLMQVESVKVIAESCK